MISFLTPHVKALFLEFENYISPIDWLLGKFYNLISSIKWSYLFLKSKLD
jgi:hypothetical protein